jgi:hypothetical protein
MNAHQKFETIAFSRKPTSKPVAADARAELLKDPDSAVSSRIIW